MIGKKLGLLYKWLSYYKFNAHKVVHVATNDDADINPTSVPEEVELSSKILDYLLSI